MAWHRAKHWKSSRFCHWSEFWVDIFVSGMELCINTGMQMHHFKKKDEMKPAAGSWIQYICPVWDSAFGKKLRLEGAGRLHMRGEL